jgi:hypothetical protein
MKATPKKESILKELDSVSIKHKKEPPSEKLYQRKRHERNRRRLGHE